MTSITSALTRSKSSVKSDDISQTRFQRIYLAAFVFAVIACWSPYKILAYLTPFLLLLFLLFLTGKKIILIRSLALCVFWILLIGFYKLINPDFILQNALLAGMTYGSFYLALIIPGKFLSSKRMLFQMAKILVMVIILQSVIGYVQVIYGFTISKTFDISNGDNVEGTIDLPLSTSPGFETPMFAVNMALSLIALIPFIVVFRKQRWLPVLLLGASILVLASVVHVLLFLILAFMISFIYYRPIQISARRVGISVLVLLITLSLIVTLMVVFLPSNLQRITVHYNRAIRFENTKTILLQRLLSDVPDKYPSLPFVGIGPGQFVSRAGLISSGYYFGGIENPATLPIIEPVVSPALDLYVMDLWRSLIGWPGSAGATNRPFASWLSIYSEFGFLGVIIVVIFVSRLLLKVKRRSRNWSDRNFAFAFGFGLIFIFLLGMQENYWETTQAILIGCMVLQCIYATVVWDRQPDIPYLSTENHGN